VIDLIEQLNQQTGSALVVVTHDQEIANHMDRQLQLTEGRLQSS
jgi:lipoprotein-releasing system ATP-binding protein